VPLNTLEYCSIRFSGGMKVMMTGISPHPLARPPLNKQLKIFEAISWTIQAK